MYGFIHLDFRRYPHSAYMSVCVSVRLFVYLQYYLFVFSITKKCPQKMSALGVGSSDASTKAREWGIEKMKKITFGPRSILGYFQNKSCHSVFYIYRLLQKLKWLCSVSCELKMIMIFITCLAHSFL